MGRFLSVMRLGLERTTFDGLGEGEEELLDDVVRNLGSEVDGEEVLEALEVDRLEEMEFVNKAVLIDS